MPTPAPLPATEVEADPARPNKAIAATVLTAVGTFVAYWVADKDPFTAKDAGQAFVAALLTSGVTGGTTFVVPNPLRRRRPKHSKG